jgi:cell division protein DivIC
MLVVGREVSTFTPDNDQPPTNNVCMKFFSNIPSFLYNKFLLAAVFFTVWMLFFDKNDFFIQMDRKKELKDLRQSKQYFVEQIAAERYFSEELKNNPAAIEKFAREQYKMKRDGEDLFLIQPLSAGEN